jgi:hypothetical protein
MSNAFERNMALEAALQSVRRAYRRSQGPIASSAEIIERIQAKYPYGRIPRLTRKLIEIEFEGRLSNPRWRPKGAGKLTVVR